MITPEYQAILNFYGDKKARRSNLPFMNHIDEALRILDWLAASEISKRAFCLHPLFQADFDFIVNWNSDLSSLNTNAIILAIE